MPALVCTLSWIFQFAPSKLISFKFSLFLHVWGMSVLAYLGLHTHVLKLALGVLFCHSLFNEAGLEPELPNSS